MYIAQKIELKPNKTTKTILEQYFGYSRYIYNKALATWNEMYEEHQENGLLEKPTHRRVRDRLKKNKEEWEENYCSQVLETGTEDVGKAFNMFFKKVSKFPKFKSKKKSKSTFRFYRKNEYSIRVTEDRFLKLATLTPIKMKEDLKYDGIIKEVTIIKKADKYFAGFVIDLKCNLPQIDNELACGIDVGIKTFATISDSNDGLYTVPSFIKTLEPLYNKASEYNRRMSRKIYNSKKYLAMKTKLQRIYLKISNIQQDYLHNITTWLTSNYKYITIETIKVNNLVKNRKLSKVISRSLFYTFRQQLEYKCEMYGNILIKADQFFPSTQTCSCCGNVRTKEDKLKLSDRTYVCPKCGNEIDRDENAAINLRNYGMSIIG